MIAVLANAGRINAHACGCFARVKLRGVENSSCRHTIIFLSLFPSAIATLKAVITSYIKSQMLAISGIGARVLRKL